MSITHHPNLDFDYEPEKKCVKYKNLCNPCAQVAVAVNGRGVATDPTTLQSALEILESIVLHSSGKYSMVEQEVTPVSLIHHLQR